MDDVPSRQHLPELGWAGPRMELGAGTEGSEGRDDELPKVREGLDMAEGRWGVLHIPMRVSHAQP